MDIEVPDLTANDADLQLEGIDFIRTGNQYLTFTLGAEHYGMDILVVKEIRGWELPARIPNSPHYVKGVTNLRGTIVPIIDLRQQFDVGEVSYSPTTVVIVLTLANDRVNRTMGFVVDAVSDVLNAEESDIRTNPSFSGSVPSTYVDGLVNVGENVVTLLNVESLLNLEESHAKH